MSRTYVSKALRRRIRERDVYRCAYCLTTEANTGMEMEVDHIIPEVLGGHTDEDNLCLSCSACNEYKGDRTKGSDADTGEQAPLFDPRHQRWGEHFAWSDDGIYIEGLTPVGRATVNVLRLNRELLVSARQRWASAGWHPPAE